MRTQLRRLQKERWIVKRSVWNINKNGEGVAVYCAIGKERSYSLVCFAHILEPAKRSDRVIANEWDTTYALYDGAITNDKKSEAEIERLARNVPKQEKGRFLASEIVFSRANKSLRLFDYVVERLAAGQQPEQKIIDSVGYLMRTTAVYGNGKFGIADREKLVTRPEMRGTFQAEMLAVWLIRSFSIDYVEQLAAFRAPKKAVKLSPEKRRSFGVGNATGLGMAPFLINHPALLHTWINARETALARVRAYGNSEKQACQQFEEQAQRALHAFRRYHTNDAKQTEKNLTLCHDLEKLLDKIRSKSFRLHKKSKNYWNLLFRWGEKNLSLEGQEMLVSLLLEPQAEIVDQLTSTMYEDQEQSMTIDGSLNVVAMLEILQKHYAWALEKDYQSPSNANYFWYISEEKLEPRLGEREKEHGAKLEQPLAIGRDAEKFYRALRKVPKDTLLAEFLLHKPQHRHIARRVQLARHRAYAEIHDNLIGSDLHPIDLLRCKLSFFGATRFDPRSDRWLRITMYQYAPLPNEMDESGADDWVYPTIAEQLEGDS